MKNKRKTMCKGMLDKMRKMDWVDWMFIGLIVLWIVTGVMILK